MARAATRNRSPQRRKPTSRRKSKPAARRWSRILLPSLSRDQRVEVWGLGALAAGLLLAAVLVVPGGGIVARPLHDALLSFMGAGAWVLALGLAATGARLCARRDGKAGRLGLFGTVLVALAFLGLMGLVSPVTGGWLGAHVGSGMARLLGWAGSAVTLCALGLVGLVMAVDLRLAPLAAWLHRSVWETDSRDKSKPRRKPKVELTGVAQPLAFPEIGATVQPDEPVVEFPEFESEVFSREFEGLAEVEQRELGPIPEVVLPHAQSETEEEEISWVLPSIDLLDTVGGKKERLQREVEVTAGKIVSTLRSFGIETRIVGQSIGPTVTQYELQPAPGVPVRKITGYQTDLSLALAAPIRIQPFIPGKSAIGIEVPNKAAQLVTLKEIVSASPFSDARAKLAIALGADVSGHPVAGDLTKMPHLLIAGATGSGKSVCINAVLGGLMLQMTPAQMKLILIDPKRVELSGFADLPHLLVPVVVEPEAAVASLRWAVKEMEERYKLFASHGARNISAFNERAPGLGVNPLPYVVIVIDELADLMMVAAGEIEDLICRVAQLARAVGIHLIVATQRPSADIVTGLIKANIPSRVAFAVSSGVDSRVILDEMGAEKLLGRGDMLYLPIDEGKPRRLQGAFVSDRELEALIGHWKSQGKPEYQEEIFHVEATVSWARDAGKRDPLFAKAAHIVAAEGRAAASLLQRKMNIGYTRAARLVDQLAEQRIVGPYEGSKSRAVLMDVLQVDELLAELGEE